MAYVYSSLLLLATGCIASPINQRDNVGELIRASVSADALGKRSVAAAVEGGLSGYNFPDPSIIQANGKWYAFATRTPGSAINIQAAQSDDFENWTLIHTSDGSQYDALPKLPSWVYAPGPATWAPDVNILDDGSYIMYYSATAASSPAQHCVGAAKASSVLGPYEPVGNDALLCPLVQGGAIDSSGFEDVGQRYIVYKIDGNSIGHGGACGNAVAPFVPTPLVLQPVAADGVTLTGAATTLLDNNGASDQGILEAPAVAKSGSTYILFFSSNCYMGGHYTISYATSLSVMGPYTRAAAPLYATGQNGLESPGGADVHTDGQHLLFHGDFGGGRKLYQSLITVNGNVVSA